MKLFGITLPNLGNIANTIEGKTGGNAQSAPTPTYNPQGVAVTQGPAKVNINPGIQQPPPAPAPNTNPPITNQPNLTGTKRVAHDLFNVGKGLVIGAPEYVGKELASTTIDPARALIANATGNQKAANNANAAELKDNMFAPVVAAGNQLASVGASGTINKNANQAQQQATNTYMDVEGNTPAGAANAEAQGAFDKTQILEGELAQNGLTDKTSATTLTGNALSTQAGITAPLAFADGAGSIMGKLDQAMSVTKALRSSGQPAMDPTPGVPENVPAQTQADLDAFDKSPSASGISEGAADRVHQGNPMTPVEQPTGSGEPLPTPPPGMAVNRSYPSEPFNGRSAEDMNSLMKSEPGDMSSRNNDQGAQDVPQDTEHATVQKPNPMNVSFPHASPKDFSLAGINRSHFNYYVGQLGQQVTDALDQLPMEDREQFVHYAEDSKNVGEATDPAAVQDAVQKWRNLANLVNAADVWRGAKTAFKENYFPHYWKDAEGNLQARNPNYEDNTESAKSYRSMHRDFENQQQGEDAGKAPFFDDPAEAVQQYMKGAMYNVGHGIYNKTVQEADQGAVSQGNITLKDNNVIKMSDTAQKALRTDIKDKPSNPIVKGFRKVNSGIKNVVTGTGFAHPMIIPQRALGGMLNLKLHTLVNNLKGGPGEFNNRFTVDPDTESAGIRMGTPMHSTDLNGGLSNINKEMGIVKKVATIPQRIVFNHMLPTIHSWLIDSAVKYAASKGYDLDGPEMRNIGSQINDVMGYAKKGTGLADDLTFAPALLKSTARMYGKSLTRSGFVERGGVAGQVLTNQAIGFLSKSISNNISAAQNKPNQESKDDFWSTVQKEAVAPSIYTPMHNSKKEQIDLHIPGQYESDAMSTVLGLQRDAKGQLKLHLNDPSEIASAVGQGLRNIESPAASLVQNVVTNKNYAGQQIRNPYSSPADQATQAVVNGASSALPINVAGAVTPGEVSHLPKPIQSAVQLNSAGGANTETRVAGTTFGLNPKADTTTGEGPAISKFYGGQTVGQDYIAAHTSNQATQTDLENDLSAYFSHQKNAQGQTIQDNPGTRIADAKMLQTNPVLMAAVVKSEQANGKGNYDPMWDLPVSKLQTFLHYQSTPTGYADRDNLLNQNSWLSGFITNRDNYYSKLTQSGQSVPAAGTPTYPKFDSQTTSDLNTINTISAVPENQRTPAQIQQLAGLYTQPNVVAAQKAKYDYDNAMQVAEGASPIQYYQDDPRVEASFKSYEALPSSTGARSAWIKANPQSWNNIQNMLAQQSQNTIDRQGAVAEFKGEQPSSSLLGAEYSAGQYDISKDANPNGSTQYSLNPAAAYAASNSSSSTSNSAYSKLLSEVKQESQNRDVEKSTKTEKYLFPKYHAGRVKGKVYLKGAPKAPRTNIPTGRGVGGVHVPRVKLKPVAQNQKGK